ncbi:MAG: hypothetical protein GX915_01885 [Clostridiales bacterium]|nr:hypothetical protein [Clostridiales bacterium]
MNNTEKLYSVLGSNLLINLIMLIELGYFNESLSSHGVYIVSYIILAISLIGTIFFKQSSIVDCLKGLLDTPNITPRIYLTLLNNCAVAILCKGVGKGVLILLLKSLLDCIFGIILEE